MRKKAMVEKYHIYYILKCNDGTYYTGVTNSIDRRVREHQNGENINSYTYKRKPIKLIFYTQFSNIDYAIEKEKQIKKWSKIKKEALINGEFELLPNLAKKKFNK